MIEMYHGRFKKSHYEAGFNWGKLLYKNGKIIRDNHTFKITEEKKFAKEWLPIYEKYYPEVLEEIKGLADGQNSSYEDFYTFLLSMYCFEFDNHCTCIAVKNNNNILFGRNSDFLVSLEKLYMNCLYNLAVLLSSSSAFFPQPVTVSTKALIRQILIPNFFFI